jgi:hypothetical protein
MNEKHSPEKIIEILRSIEGFSAVDDELETIFNNRGLPFQLAESISSFQPGSFTRELLELIEKHLLGG